MRFTETPGRLGSFAPDYAVPLLENGMGVLSLEGFGLQGRPAAATTAGAICTTSAPRNAARWSMWTAYGFYDRQEYLVLDAVTVRNLELESRCSPHAIEVTSSARLTPRSPRSGKRLLRSWMLRPPSNIGEITARLDAVEDRRRRSLLPGKSCATRSRACSISSAC